MINNLKIAFMGSGLFAYNIITKLINQGVAINTIYTKPNKPSGRGQKLTESMVYNLAVANNINVVTVPNFKNLTDAQQFINAGFDVALVASYGVLLPDNMLNAPKYGCVNVHGSVLPYWRGASPVQTSILHNKACGVTLMQMDKGLDTGDIIEIVEYNLTNNSYFTEVFNDLSVLGANMLLNYLNNIANNIPIKTTKQNNALATKCGIITKQQGALNFNNLAQHLQNQVRAFQVFPTSFFTYNNTIIKVLKASVVNNITNITATAWANQPVGTIINNSNLQILCANNTVLQIDTLQRPSKKPMEYNVFKQGFNFNLGDTLN